MNSVGMNAATLNWAAVDLLMVTFNVYRNERKMKIKINRMKLERKW